MTIQITQTLGVGAAGAGEALVGAWLNKAVTITLPVGSGYLHEFLAKPTGSSASLATPSAQVASFTPDEIGTYRIRSRVTVAGVTTYYVRVVRVTADNTGAPLQAGLCAPASGESPADGATTTQPQGAVDLWAENLAIIAAALAGISSPPSPYGSTPAAIAAAGNAGASAAYARGDHVHPHGGVSTATNSALCARDGSAGCAFAALACTTLTASGALTGTSFSHASGVTVIDCPSGQRVSLREANTEVISFEDIGGYAYGTVGSGKSGFGFLASATNQSIFVRADNGIYLDSTFVVMRAKDASAVYHTFNNAAIGVFGAGAVGKQTVTGSRGGNAALASFLTAMAAYGWITDSTSA